MIPISNGVRGACEILGFNALHLANEGCFIAFVKQDHVAATLEILRNYKQCNNACVIGRVSGNQQGLVMLRTLIGGNRVLDMPSGELLPRIC